MGREGLRELGQLRCIAMGVVHAVDQCPLERKPSPFGSQVLPARSHEHGNWVAAVERDDLVAELVAGGVQGDGEVDGQGFGGEPADAWDDAYGRQRDVARRDAKVGMQQLHRRPRPVVIGKRLSHAHEDDVAEPAGERLAPRLDDLFDDLSHRELAVETGLARRAETAAHGTARLAGDAHRGALGIEHQDRLYAPAVGKLPEPFGCLAVGGDRACDLVEGRFELGPEPFTQALWQVGHVAGEQAPFPQPFPDLLGAVTWFVR